MRSGSVRLIALGAALALVPAIPVIAGDPSIAFPSLWVVDDTLKVTADVTPDGDLTTSFLTPNTAISSVAVDPLDGTLWGANEGGMDGAGKLVNYDTDGTVLRQLEPGPATFDAFGIEGVEVADDGSFWLVDDPDVDERVDTVWHVAPDGSRAFRSFPMSSFAPPGADSPQDIAIDPDGTLWITDNGSDAVYHVTTDGQLLGSFSTAGGPFAAELGNGVGITNPQGISVESPGVLWLTGRGIDRLLRLTVSGRGDIDVTITDTLPASAVAPGASNPAGIHYTSTTTAPSTRAAVGLLHEALVEASPELGRRDQRWLDRAIEQLTTALMTDAFWTEDGEPTEAGEENALSSIKNAVRFLERVRSTTPTIDAVSISLVGLARGAAIDQIERAEELPTDPVLVADARAKVAQGDSVADESPERAANDYKAAWETATLAITQFFATPGGSLWVVDDGLQTSANITPAGSLNFAVGTPNTAFSSIAVDPTDGTLWGANEASLGVGKLVNYALDGTVIDEISADVFGAVGTEGVAVAPDGTLWVVDDPGVGQDRVYHVARDGSFMSSFPTSDFAGGPLGQATSPQDIAYDPYDDTLWITDNSADAVFHVATDGTLLGGFSTRGGVFGTATGDLRNPQGITVESPYHLWITDRSAAGQLVRVDKSGSYLLEMLPASVVGPGAGNPTGIAYLSTVPSQPVVEVAALESVETQAIAVDGAEETVTTEPTTDEVGTEPVATDEPAVDAATTGTSSTEESAAGEPAAEKAADGGATTEEPPGDAPAGDAPAEGSTSEEPAPAEDPTQDAAPATEDTEAADADGTTGAGAATTEDAPTTRPEKGAKGRSGNG